LHDYATATFVIIGAPEADAGKAKFQRTKPHVNVGTIGHVDHSKTPVGRQFIMPGLGKFTPTHRKARRNKRAGTNAMRIKAMQIRTLEGSARNDRRFFKSRTGSTMRIFFSGE
jgi:hypothetical protein